MKLLFAKRAAGLSTAVALMFTAACSSTPASDSGSKKEEAPVSINILSDFTIAQPPSADNPVLKEFEKKTNTKLNITWVNGPDFVDRLNVVLSSGDLPDLLKLDDMTNPVFQTMVKQGAFWDLTPYLKDYANLSAYPKSIFENTKVDGKNYVIPVARPLNGFAFPSVRKDWLDKLGLKVPETMDDLYNVMKAFKQQAPDGKSDTFGYNMRANDFIDNVFTDANGRWKDVGGNLVDVNLDPGMRDAILYKKKLYDEGLIPQDFSIMKETQFWDMATSGRAGVTSETIEATWRWTYDQWKRDPKVEWLPLVSLSAKNGPFVPEYRGYIGVLAIPKKVPEAKMKKILSVLDYGASDEGGTLSLYGLKGVHYNEDNGLKVTTDQAVKDSVGVGAFGKMFMKYDPYMYAFAPGMTKDIFERNKKIIDARAKIAKPDPAIGLVSDTDIKQGADYKKKLADLKTQVIMGKAGIDAWDKLVSDLKQDATYQKIIQEMNTAYKARKAAAGK